jgi:hypothetical protein
MGERTKTGCLQAWLGTRIKVARMFTAYVVRNFKISFGRLFLRAMVRSNDAEENVKPAQNLLSFGIH